MTGELAHQSGPPAHRRFDREPHVWSDEDRETAYVDATAQTPTRHAAKAWLLDHGSDIGVDEGWEHFVPEKITTRQLHVELHDVDELPDAPEVRALVERGRATAMWVFDISAATEEVRDGG